MSIKGIVIKKAVQTGLTLRKYSPQIALVGGVIGFGATTYLSGRAALKAQPVVAETKHLLREAQMAKLEAAKDETSLYDEKAYRRDIAMAYTYAFKDLAKVYAPVIAVGGVSIAALIAGHRIQSARLSQVTMAYTGLQAAFEKYREAAVEKFEEFEKGSGKDTDRSIMEKITEKVSGEDEDSVPNLSAPTSYWFTEATSSDYQGSRFANMRFLEDVQNAMNRRLQGNGFVFLNDVLDALGMDRIPAGQQLGWINRGDKAGSFVDFGLGMNPDIETKATIEESIEHGDVFLDFNVDGVIWNLI